MDRVRYRWWTAGVAVVVVAGAGVWIAVALPTEESESNSHFAASECVISILDGPNGADDIHAEAVSGSGDYILGSTDETAIRWRDGEPEVLDELTGAAVINSAGVIAGVAESAWRHADGETVELSAPGEDVEVTAVNDAGDVVGGVRDPKAEAEVADGDPVSSRGTPLLWPAGESTPVELSVAEGGLAWAQAVADDGTVLGYQVADGTDSPRPWRWQPDGTGSELPPQPGEDARARAVPVDVAGDWVLSTDAPYGYRWRLSEPDGGEKLKLDKQSAIAVDAKGGAYGLAEWDEPGRQLGDEVLPLPKLSQDPDGGLRGSDAVRAASDDGRVLIGSSLDDDGVSRAVTWRCG